MKTLLNRRAFLALASLGGAAGCSLQRAALPERTFLIEGPQAGAPVAGDPAGVMLVRLFRVAPAFDSRACIIRRGEAEYVADAYHAFLLSPGPMLTEAVATWLRSLGVFRTVTTGGSQVAATHALEADVNELYGDYRDPAAPRAVLAMQFRLLHPLAGSTTNVLWQRSERQSEPIVRADADALVAGWSRALAEVCRRLEPAFLPRPAATPGAQT